MWWKRRRRSSKTTARALVIVRENAAAVGYPLGAFTDADLEPWAVPLVEAMTRGDITAAEFADALRRLHASRSYEPRFW